jgi:hypothetical protein
MLCNIYVCQVHNTAGLVLSKLCRLFEGHGVVCDCVLILTVLIQLQFFMANDLGENIPLHLHCRTGRLSHAVETVKNTDVSEYFLPHLSGLFLFVRKSVI